MNLILFIYTIELALIRRMKADKIKTTMPKKIEPKIKLHRQNDTLFRQIVDLWRERISTGALKEGDILPSEREQAEQFGVSRVPVREAMKVLEYLGFVKQMRAGGGVVQKANPREILGTVGPMLIATPEILADLFEVRILLEPFAAYRAALEHTEEDLHELQSALVDMQSGISLSSGARVEESSFLFHMKIIDMSNNSVLLMFTYFLSELQRQSRHKTLWSEQRMQEAFHFHEQIYEKIKNRNAQEAQELMESHLKQASLPFKKDVEL